MSDTRQAEATAAYYAAREVIDTILRNREHLPAGLVERAVAVNRNFTEGES